MPPSPPVGLPPPERSVVQLRRTPLYLTMGVAVVLTGVVFYAVTHMGREQKKDGNASAEQPAGSAVDLAELFKNAPDSAEIAARRRAKPIIPASTGSPATVTTQPPPPASAPPPPLPDDMTEAAIAMRRAAWAAYSQQLLDHQQKRVERARTSMQADLGSGPDQNTSTPTGASQGGGGPLANGGGNQGHQGQDFFAANASRPETDYLPYTITGPISPYEVKATDIVTAKLESQLSSDRPGILRARVTKNVYDHSTGNHILIPQGSILKGVYDTNVAYGQTSVTTAWQRIIYPPPCDQSLDLGAMPGADQSGQAGFEDITEEHLGKIFTSALLVSIFGAAAQLSQPAGNSFQSYSPTQTAAGAVGQQMAQLGAQFAQKGLSIPPTQKVRQGYSFTIMLTQDIAFERPWHEGVCEEMDLVRQ